MAIDKNSNAYKALLKNGYTEDQINQMYQQTSSGKSASQAIESINKQTTTTTKTTPTPTPTQTQTTTTPTQNTTSTVTTAGTNKQTTSSASDLSSTANDKAYQSLLNL